MKKVACELFGDLDIRAHLTSVKRNNSFISPNTALKKIKLN